jgi:hypothetical protein
MTARAIAGVYGQPAGIPGSSATNKAKPTVPEGRLPKSASVRLGQMFGRGSWAEVRRVADVLRTETVGGLLLLGAPVVALIWANTPWSDHYHAFSDLRVGISTSRWRRRGQPTDS